MRGVLPEPARKHGAYFGRQIAQRRDGPVANVFDDLVFISIDAVNEPKNGARIRRTEKSDVLFQGQAHGEVVFGFEVLDLRDLVGNRASVLNPAWTTLID